MNRFHSTFERFVEFWMFCRSIFFVTIQHITIAAVAMVLILKDMWILKSAGRMVAYILFYYISRVTLCECMCAHVKERMEENWTAGTSVSVSLSHLFFHWTMWACMWCAAKKKLLVHSVQGLEQNCEVFFYLFCHFGAKFFHFCFISLFCLLTTHFALILQISTYLFLDLLNEKCIICPLIPTVIDVLRFQLINAMAFFNQIFPPHTLHSICPPKIACFAWKVFIFFATCVCIQHVRN